MNSPAGAGRRVAVLMPEPLADLTAVEAALQARETRVLPLSGKSDQALKDLAGRYLSWLDERDGEPASPGAAEDRLADMAWTAGVGRSHFGHRTGLVFRDAQSLRAGLSALASSGAGPAPPAPSKVAFVYTGQGSHWVGMGEKLYRSEPVARAVLDRCDSVLRQDRGISLLDVMFGRNGSEADLSDQAWTQPAVFCAGVRPHGAVVEPGRPSRCRARAQPGGTCRGPGGGGVRPGGRAEVCRGPGRTDGKAAKRSHGCGVCAGAAGGSGGPAS